MTYKTIMLKVITPTIFNNHQPPFQQQQISGSNYNSNTNSAATRLRILNDKPEDKGKKIVAIIISFCNCSSYDNLFTTV